MPVPLDSLTITFLARDLDRWLRGREIERVAIGEDKLLAISLGGGAGALRFLYDPAFPVLWVAEPGHGAGGGISGSAGVGHGSTGAGPGPAGGLPAPRFEDALRGCRITRVEQLGLERVIRIDAQPGPSSTGGANPDRATDPDSAGRARGDSRTFHLYFELAPPFPNLFLTDDHNTVLAVLLRAGTKTKKRLIEQGQPYAAPASQAKHHPFEVTPAELEALPWQKDDQALARAVLGVSPFLAREIVWRASEHGPLAAAFSEVVSAYRGSQASPCIFTAAPELAKHAPRLGIAWYRPTMKGVSDVRPMPSVNAAAAAAARAFLRTSAFERKKASLARALTKEIDRWRAVKHDAEKARRGKDKAAEFRRWGELITAHLAKIKKGASEARLPDIYSETHRTVVVPLAPHLTPHANADTYFKRARKAERSAHMAEETIRGANRRLGELEGLLREVDEATEAKGPAKVAYARLGEIERQLGRATTTRKEKAEEADTRAASLGIKPRRFTIAEGWTVLVGRSAEENDVLTHKYASPSDLWFHARLAQGSHVVLRRDRKKTEPSREAIIEAARLAAYYSKAKNSKHVPVSYTEKRYVKKVRKGAPGLAAMLREKVVFVNPAPPKEAAE